MSRVAPQFPPEVMESLILDILANMKAKLPTVVDDAILREIIITNMQITWDHIQTIPN